MNGKRICLVVLLLASLLLSGCSVHKLLDQVMNADLDQVAQWEKDMFGRFYSTNREQSEAMMQKFIAAIESRDEAALKELFSDLVIGNTEGFDDQIAQLFAFYEGSAVSIYTSGPGSHSEKNGEVYYKEIFDTFEIRTDSQAYRITYKFCTIDSVHPENVGILSVYIIKEENLTDPSRAYWGPPEEEQEAGIHIEEFR